MRILVASYYPLPDSGGISTYVHWIKHGLTRLGHEVDVLSPQPGLQGYYIPSRGVQVSRSALRRLVYQKMSEGGNGTAPQDSRFVRSLESERYSLELAALYFGLEGYDLIHAQDAIASLALGRVKPAQVPLITTVHGPLHREFQKFQIRHGIHRNETLASAERYLRQLEQRGLRFAERVLVSSRWLQQVLAEDYVLPAGHAHVLPAGMDIADFLDQMEWPSSVRLSGGVVNLLCPARLEPIKGHLHLLEALAQLKQQRVNWRCWLVGEGALKTRLVEGINEFGLANHVVFLGSRPDVPALLKQADVVVLPSLQENQPFAIMEAHIAGRAVVATAAGGVLEMVRHEDTGLLSPPGNSSALAVNLRRVLEDVHLRQGIAHRGRQFGLENWSLDIMMGRLQETYENLLQATADSLLHATDQTLLNPGGNPVVAEAQPDCQVHKLSIWQRCMRGAPANYRIPDSFSREPCGPKNS